MLLQDVRNLNLENLQSPDPRISFLSFFAGNADLRSLQLIQTFLLILSRNPRYIDSGQSWSLLNNSGL